MTALTAVMLFILCFILSPRHCGFYEKEKGNIYCLAAGARRLENHSLLAMTTGARILRVS